MKSPACLIATTLFFAACAGPETSDVSESEDAVLPVAELAAGSYAKTTGNLNLRNGPGTTFDILRVLPQGTFVAVHERHGDWYAVDADTDKGWVSGRYLTEAPAPEPAPTDPGTDDPNTCAAWMTDARATCSPDGTQLGTCANGTPIMSSCARGCLRSGSPSRSDQCLGAANTDSASCPGSWGTKKATDGDYYITAFGCWLDANGSEHTDAGDNCIPSCLAEAKAAGLCRSNDSGPDCEERLTWYTADGGRFGCLTRLRITNPANGRSVIGVALDYGPGCRVERSAGKAVLDASGRINRQLFGTDHGWSDRALVHVVEVDSSTPLGPVQ